MFSTIANAARIAATNPAVRTFAVTAARNFAVNVAIHASAKTLIDAAVSRFSVVANRPKDWVKPPRDNKVKLMNFVDDVAFYSKEFLKNSVDALTNPMVWIGALGGAAVTTTRVHYPQHIKPVAAAEFAVFSATAVWTIFRRKTMSWIGEVVGDLAPEQEEDPEVAAQMEQQRIIDEELQKISTSVVRDYEVAEANISTNAPRGTSKRRFDLKLDIARVKGGGPASRKKYGREIAVALVKNPTNRDERVTAREVLSTAMSLQFQGNRPMVKNMLDVLAGFDEENKERCDEIARDEIILAGKVQE